MEKDVIVIQAKLVDDSKDLKEKKIEEFSAFDAYIALNEIRNNPNHGYSPEVVSELLKVEAELKESIKKMRKSFSLIERTFICAAEVFQAVIYQEFSPAVFALQDASAKGWYISPDAIRKYGIKQMKRWGADIKYFERTILKDFNLLQSDIFLKCISEFPHRKIFFKEILKNFKSRNYNSAILLAYSQLDGMCTDAWGFSFFGKEEVVKKDFQLKAHLHINEMDLGIISLFADQLGFKYNEITLYAKNFDQQKSETTFNRHHVMHGHSLYYGTRLNAIRAILALDFVRYFIQFVKNNQSKKVKSNDKNHR